MTTHRDHHRRDHPAITEADGPSANGDPMGTPALDERVLWKGRPNLPVLTRTAFHMGSYAMYMTAMVLLALVWGNIDSAMFLAGAGLFGALVIQLIAWRCANSTLYILTDVRLIMRIGMAIETRINIPLKQVKSAHFRPRGPDHGDIALELNGDERVLGTLLLWPHVRPWHYAQPQPMLRSVADATSLARLIADVRAQYGAIDRNLIEIKDARGASGQHGAQPAAGPARAIPVGRRSDNGLGEQGLEGAPA